MIEIYFVDNGWVDKETFLRLTRTNHHMWDLAEVQRGHEYRLEQFDQRELGFCAAKAMSFWGSESESPEDEPEWSDVGETLVEAQKILEQHVDPKCYELNSPVKKLIEQGVLRKVK